jgi:hypothetical protein
MLKEIFEHFKRVAIQDFKDFFAPFVWVWGGIRRFVRFLAHLLKSWFVTRKHDDE